MLSGFFLMHTAFTRGSAAYVYLLEELVINSTTRMAQAKNLRTIDHDEIRQWVEDRGGQAAIVASSRSADSGLLRIDFGEKGEELEQIPWEDFFRLFEEYDLAFVYQEELGDGEVSYSYQFVARGPEDEMQYADDATLEDTDTPEM